MGFINQLITGGHHPAMMGQVCGLKHALRTHQALKGKTSQALQNGQHRPVYMF